MRYTAIVLAGSRPGRDRFAASFGADLKALIPVAGEPMLRRPVRALLTSANVGEVIVLTHEAERVAAILPEDKRLIVRKSGETIASTLLALCGDPNTEWPLLVTTADHALLDVATIDEFCDLAEAFDISIAVVERRAMRRRLPRTTRTWLRFRGGAYTGANLFALKSPKAAAAIELWREVEQDRKKGWRVISLLGPAALMGTVLRVLSIDDVLKRVGRKLALSIVAIRMSNPLAGIDVDKPEDHALVEAILKGKA